MLSKLIMDSQISCFVNSSSQICFSVSDKDGLDKSLKKLLRFFAVRFQFFFKEICIEVNNCGVDFCKISYFLSLGANIMQNILTSSIFSKFQKNLFDFPPELYQLQQLLILIPLLMSSYISFNSFLNQYIVILFLHYLRFVPNLLIPFLEMKLFHV